VVIYSVGVMGLNAYFVPSFANMPRSTRSTARLTEPTEIANIKDEKMMADAILRYLEMHRNERNRQGMKSFGINVDHAYDISTTQLRALVKILGSPHHDCALQLWKSGVHEARILSTMLYDPAQMTSQLADQMAADVDSWDICDQACMNIWRRMPERWELAYNWVEDERTFVRRCGFALVASMASKKGSTPAAMAMSGTDEQFIAWLQGPVPKHAIDGRNFVKKAVHWSIRQIGKRNPTLWSAALACAEALVAHHDPVARWVGREAFRELSKHPMGATATTTTTIKRTSKRTLTTSETVSDKAKRAKNEDASSATSRPTRRTTRSKA
jgi:3-methyladenine DNA glycosylase AlkD